MEEIRCDRLFEQQCKIRGSAYQNKKNNECSEESLWYIFISIVLISVIVSHKYLISAA
jgi:hypothetical protein